MLLVGGHWGLVALLWLGEGGGTVHVAAIGVVSSADQLIELDVSPLEFYLATKAIEEDKPQWRQGEGNTGNLGYTTRTTEADQWRRAQPCSVIISIER